MTYIKRSILFLMCAITVYRCFYFDWNRPAERWDEQTNIDVINKSSKIKQFPQLFYGNKPFFEKPPIWYMLSVIVSRAIHAPTLQIIRLFSATCGFITILVVWYISVRWWGFTSGVLSWVILLSTNHLFLTNPAGVFSTHTLRSADSEGFFILCIVLSSIVSTKIGYSNISAIASGILTGLAILSKSPIGIIPLLCATCYILFQRNNSTAIKQAIIAWCFALCMYALWVLYMSKIYGFTFLNTFFYYHLFLRASTPLESHNQSLFYYFRLLFSKELFVFMELYILSLVIYMRSSSLRSNIQLANIFSISICFIVIPTLVQTKLAWYIFPFYPFAALLIAGTVTPYLSFRAFSGKRV